ncbi:MAG: hypothetical protein ABI471_08340 [Sphingomonas bacterium]
MILATVLGAVIAIPVNLLGTAVMTWPGDGNPAARLPVIWAIVGATTFALPVAMAEARAEYLVSCVFTGASCALICRCGIQWQPLGQAGFRHIAPVQGDDGTGERRG